MRVRLESIGCRLNISEIESLARQFASAGHRLVGPDEPADLCVFNTCAVTHIASRKSRQVIRQLRRNNPAAAVVVTGCYAQLSPAEVERLGVDLVVSNEDKDRLLEVTRQAGLVPAAPLPPLADPDESLAEPLPAARTRAFVKVQDGCDNRCTFCIVTIARGAGRSRPLAEVVREIQALVAQGYQEAVLSGVHLGSYGHDRGDRDGLRNLVRAVLADTDLPRLRLSSLEPWDLDAEFFRLWDDPRLCPHLHLPLQSGCDATLRRMARRTSQAEFSALVEAARAAIPDLSLTTDVIVGFPGETDAEFEESLAFVERMAFAHLHIFRFSPREGTVAARMPGQVDPQVAQDRSQRLHELERRQGHAFRRRFLGRELPVLWETSEPTPGGLLWNGLTPNYLRAFTFTDQDLHNRITPVRLGSLLPDGLLGELPGPFGPLRAREFLTTGHRPALA